MKEATLQVRMEADLKQEAEELFRRMGTSLAEAVRIFARQSVSAGGMPFLVQLDPPKGRSMFGAASKYADPSKRRLEEGAWLRSARG